MITPKQTPPPETMTRFVHFRAACTYVKSLKDYEAMARRIEVFFHLTSVYEYDYLPPLGRVVHSAGEFLRDVDRLPIESN